MNCVFFVAYWSGQVNIYLLYNLAENVTACPKAGLHDGVSGGVYNLSSWVKLCGGYKA